MKRLSRRFYGGDPLAIAESLIGRMLYHDSSDGLVGGRIVEAEAYMGSEDPGSHGFRRRTPRNDVMFGPPGHLYVYFTYGMHFCTNVVCGRDGEAAAVLLRAVEPLIGLDLMANRRGIDDPRLLTKGPGRLSQAFGFGRDQNGEDLVEGHAWVAPARKLAAPLKTSIRIGLPAGLDQPWRVYEEGPWVSGPKQVKPAAPRKRR